MSNPENMIRKQIYLEARQVDKVKKLSAANGKSEAEIIREAIDQYRTRQSEDVRTDPLTQLIGMVDIPVRDGSTEHDRDLYDIPRDSI